MLLLSFDFFCKKSQGNMNPWHTLVYFFGEKNKIQNKIYSYLSPKPILRKYRFYRIFLPNSIKPALILVFISGRKLSQMKAPNYMLLKTHKVSEYKFYRTTQKKRLFLTSDNNIHL